MADYEALVFQTRDDGRVVTVTNPTARHIAGMMVEQRRPFGSVWDGAEELVHVVRGGFVTVPPLAPGATVTLRFDPTEPDAPWVRQGSTKGLTVLDARRDPRTGETRIRVRVCRAGVRIRANANKDVRWPGARTSKSRSPDDGPEQGAGQ
jgi:hypothetical protein